MFREIRDCAQKKNESFRRWFEDDYFDLIVWYEPDRKTLRDFQLCYDRFGNEHALSWHRLYGFAHDRVKAESRMYTGTPVLVANGPFPVERIRQFFGSSSGSLDPEVRAVVLAKIEAFVH